MEIHSSIPTWEISWTEEPGRLQAMGLQDSDYTDPGVSVPGGGGQRRPTPCPVQDHAWESEEDDGGLWRHQSTTSRLPRQLLA